MHEFHRVLSIELSRTLPPGPTFDADHASIKLGMRFEFEACFKKSQENVGTSSTDLSKVKVSRSLGLAMLVRPPDLSF